MTKLSNSIVRYPARIVTLWFAVSIIAGSVLLRLPICSASTERPITTLEAFFTSTSATCVTGLSLRSTMHDFTWFGQLVIMGLIQVGGVGIMTITTFVVSSMGSAADLRQRAVINQTLGVGGQVAISTVLRRVLILTATIEFSGAALLLPRFLDDMPMKEAVWFSLFHAVSAFCNAGFALWDDSLTRFQNDWYVNAVMSYLIVVGGIGFPVLLDLVRYIRRRRSGNAFLHVHTKVTLYATGILIVLGAVAFFFLEQNGVLQGKTFGNRVLASLFQSITTRTAGFNTVDFSQLSHATLLICMILMMIGAAPCSTGGGVKVSTIAILVLHAYRSLQGHESISIFRRTIPQSVVNRAMASLVLFVTLGGLALTALLVAEPRDGRQMSDFDFIAFEVVSALGTVGLSAGATSTLSSFGQVIIIGLMFMGRIGPISVFAALSRTNKPSAVRYASEEPLIG